VHSSRRTLPAVDKEKRLVRCNQISYTSLEMGGTNEVYMEAINMIVTTYLR
jgi:hypothetical protein